MEKSALLMDKRSLGRRIPLGDGVWIELVELDNSLCPVGALCFWAGIFSAVLRVGGAGVERSDVKFSWAPGYPRIHKHVCRRGSNGTVCLDLGVAGEGKDAALTVNFEIQ